MTNSREDQIRQRAHEIWEREGRPHGQHDQHWAQALTEIEREAGGQEGEAAQMASMKGVSDDPAETGVAGGRTRKALEEDTTAVGSKAKARKPRSAAAGFEDASTAPTRKRSGPREVTTEGTKPDGAPPSRGRGAPRASTKAVAEGSTLSDIPNAAPTKGRRRKAAEAPEDSSTTTARAGDATPEQ